MATDDHTPRALGGPQLWFGMVVSVAFAVLSISLRPFSEPLCQTLHTALALLIMLTYTSAALYVPRESLIQSVQSGAVGDFLVALNVAMIATVVALGVRAVLRARRATDQLRLEHADDGSPVVLTAPHVPSAGGGGASAGGGFHCFLSHVWRYGQDQAGTLKSSLHTMLPGCSVFLECAHAATAPPPRRHRTTPPAPSSAPLTRAFARVTSARRSPS